MQSASTPESERFFSLAAQPQLAENSRQGSARKNRALVPSFATLNSQTPQWGSWQSSSRTASDPTVYLYDGVNDVEEVDNSGNVLARYAATTDVDEPLSELRGSTGSYYHQDGLGAVTSLSNGSGALANTYTFDSFGKLNASTGTLTNPFQYTGRESDQETGLYYYRARYYDPNVGRFISEDPIRFSGGEDFYPYVANSAPNFSDAFGLCKERERELCRRQANRRYIERMMENKKEAEERANEVGLDWFSEGIFTQGVEHFLSGPVAIETGVSAIKKWTHKIVPVIEIYHAGKAVKEEVDVMEETYRKWRDAELQLKHDLELCDSL